MDDNYKIARVYQIKRWSPVWIIPIVTVLIGAWIIFYHFSHRGPAVILLTSNAEGIEAGKTNIKSHSVDVGVVESVALTNDFHHVEIKVRLNFGMENLLRKDSAFWIVKPSIGSEGITGLGTLLSGSYIELQPGVKGTMSQQYNLLDAPPLAPLDAKGVRIKLNSEKAGQLSVGDPVLFRGYRVGSVETSVFDPNKRMMSYQLFITAPYDLLVTSNVRFWKDSGIAVDMSASGMRVQMGSLTTLFSGGVSFDVPDGWGLGKPAEDKKEYHLFNDQRNIQDSLYTVHKDFLVFFSESIRGLQPGAPVEFRGIRLGTVSEVPFTMLGMTQHLNNDYRIPVLIRIESDRFKKQLGNDFHFEQRLKDGISRGLRASLKSANLLTGSLYVDLDFYNNAKPYTGPSNFAEYELIPTVSIGLAQIQQKMMESLDKINNLPLNSMLNETTSTLKNSRQTLKKLQKTLDNLNKITSSQSLQELPGDMKHTLHELNRGMQGFQPGSPAYNKLVSDMQRFNQVLRELQPVLKTLSTKSNALIFEAKTRQDPQPKRMK